MIPFVSSAIAGLIGAAIGALAGVAGAFISQRMQARATQKRTLQSKREEAYSNTLRNLLKVQNTRDEWSSKDGVWIGHITAEGIMSVYPDMIEAQFWASALTMYCSEDQREPIKRVSNSINNTVADFVS